MIFLMSCSKLNIEEKIKSPASIEVQNVTKFNEFNLTGNLLNTDVAPNTVVEMREGYCYAFDAGIARIRCNNYDERQIVDYGLTFPTNTRPGNLELMKLTEDVFVAILRYTNPIANQGETLRLTKLGLEQIAKKQYPEITNSFGDDNRAVIRKENYWLAIIGHSSRREMVAFIVNDNFSLDGTVITKLLDTSDSAIIQGSTVFGNQLAVSYRGLVGGPSVPDSGHIELLDYADVTKVKISRVQANQINVNGIGEVRVVSDREGNIVTSYYVENFYSNGDRGVLRRGFKIVGNSLEEIVKEEEVLTPRKDEGIRFESILYYLEKLDVFFILVINQATKTMGHEIFKIETSEQGSNFKILAKEERFLYINALDIASQNVFYREIDEESGIINILIRIKPIQNDFSTHKIEHHKMYIKHSDGITTTTVIPTTFTTTPELTTSLTQPITTIKETTSLTQPVTTTKEETTTTPELISSTTTEGIKGSIGSSGSSGSNIGPVVGGVAGGIGILGGMFVAFKKWFSKKNAVSYADQPIYEDVGPTVNLSRLRELAGSNYIEPVVGAEAQYLERKQEVYDNSQELENQLEVLNGFGETVYDIGNNEESVVDNVAEETYDLAARERGSAINATYGTNLNEDLETGYLDVAEEEET